MAHDLRQFFHAVGRFRGQKALTSTPTERPEPDVPAELIEEVPSLVSAAPLAVDAFVDGVQASLCVTHRPGHRPVYLSYVAAGALGAGALPIGLREELAVVCSSLDLEWVQGLGTTIPVESLAATDPLEVERGALALLGGGRERLERDLVVDLVDQGYTRLVLDGSLVGRPHNPALVGVVKSTGRKYLADESVLYGLAPGWRSPRFKIHPNTAGSPELRYSCYLRLFDASAERWNYGLIRLEVFADPDLLDPLAARCLAERQNPAAGDPRFDRHLSSVHACEEFLRARRPAVFALPS